ncbi:MAG: nitroreductase family protein, partial [Flavobacteriaceae bacterium]|nr:nitroreductase family protein [Flavobacteriaceae bacterium]
MSDLDVLIKVPKERYYEPATEVNGDEFQKVIESRRSVRIFTEEAIPNNIMNRCLDNALLAPNSSNLQPWEFYWVKSEDKKQVLVHACMNQLAAKTAQELIVCVARMDQWRNRQKDILDLFSKSEKSISQGAWTYYRKIVPFAYTQGWFSLIGFFKKFVFFL